jgi:hypothetical protein
VLDRIARVVRLFLDLLFMCYLRPVVLLASLDPEPPIQRPRMDKGKGRAVGERTRDWTPLVRREQEMARLTQQQRRPTPQSAAARQAELHLVPPPELVNNSNFLQAAHLPRQPRKRLAKERDTTVKQEEQDLYIAQL